MKKELPGIELEKIVAEIQKQFDVSSTVSHDEKLIDRHGHKRQFDVVIRGKFAGQDILGVIECKDLKKKVGNPEIDAFVTKASDINANFKIIVSRKGFSKPALEKAKHYGIQTVSLLPEENSSCGFIVGSKWQADLYRWDKIALTLEYVKEPDEEVYFSAEEVTISGKRVIDWFTNYLCKNHPTEDKEGWMVNIGVKFEKPQTVCVRENECYECDGLAFHAFRIADKKEKLVGWSGTGFYDWQNSKVSLPPKGNIKSYSVPVNFLEWEDRKNDDVSTEGFLTMKIIAHNVQFEMIEDAIDLEII